MMHQSKIGLKLLLLVAPIAITARSVRGTHRLLNDHDVSSPDDIYDEDYDEDFTLKAVDVDLSLEAIENNKEMKLRAVENRAKMQIELIENEKEEELEALNIDEFVVNNMKVRSSNIEQSISTRTPWGISITNAESGRRLYAQSNRSGESGFGGGVGRFYPDQKWHFRLTECGAGACSPEEGGGPCFHIENKQSGRRIYATAFTDLMQCGSESVKQADYRGTVSKTASGLECQRWDSQSPHQHNRTPQRYSNSGLNENYCRNPDGEDLAWCYTNNPDKRWEYCDIPKCADPDDPPTQNNRDYESGVGAVSANSNYNQDQKWMMEITDCDSDDTCYIIRNIHSCRRLYAQSDKSWESGVGADDGDTVYSDQKWIVDLAQYYRPPCTSDFECDNEDEFCNPKVFECRPKQYDGFFPCINDSQCFSNRCIDTVQQCAPKKPDGGTCVANKECESGMCNKVVVGNAGLCGEPRPCRNDDNCYQTEFCNRFWSCQHKHPDDFYPCFEDRQCKSERCEDITRKCIPKKGLSAGCASNKECKSDRCKFFTCVSK